MDGRTDEQTDRKHYASRRLGWQCHENGMMHMKMSKQ